MTCLDVVLMPLLTGSLFDHDEFAALALCFIQPDSGLTKGGVCSSVFFFQMTCSDPCDFPTKFDPLKAPALRVGAFVHLQGRGFVLVTGREFRGVSGIRAALSRPSGPSVRVPIRSGTGLFSIPSRENHGILMVSSTRGTFDPPAFQVRTPLSLRKSAPHGHHRFLRLRQDVPRR